MQAEIVEDGDGARLDQAEGEHASAAGTGDRRSAPESGSGEPWMLAPPCPTSAAPAISAPQPKIAASIAPAMVSIRPW